MLRKILSEGEFETRRRILSASEKHNAECFSLIRVADVIGNLRESGLSVELVSYALRAHFDFLICDHQSEPLFAIEYDGAQHSSPEQQHRDLMKDDICRHFGLPFVRIDSRHLYRWKEDVVKWLIDYWFYSKWLEEAQVAGDLPADEIPDPMMMLGFIDEPGRYFPMMIGLKYRASIMRLHSKGTLPVPTPFDWIGVNDSRPGCYSAISLLKISADQWVAGSIRMTAFNFGFVPSDVVSELVLMELFKMLKAHFAHTEQLFASADAIGALLERTVNGYGRCQTGGGHENLVGIPMSTALSAAVRFT